MNGETYVLHEDCGWCRHYLITSGPHAGWYRMMFRHKRKRGRRVFIFWH